MLRACLYLFIYVLSIRPIFAVEVTPMVVTLSPDDNSSLSSSLVHNKLPRNIAFDIQVYEIDFSKGTHQLVPLDDPPLWVFPPSLFLKPGQSQRLQFKWLNKEMPSTDKSYQVSLIEQPITELNSSKKSQITMLLNVNLIVHLDQAKLIANLLIKDTHVKGNFIFTKVNNEGSGASRLSDYEIKVKNGSTTIKHFLKGELKAGGYDVFFAPKSTSLIKIPISTALKKESLNNLHVFLAD